MYILKHIRLELGMTARQFGGLFGLAPTTIFNYEYGHRFPSYKTASKIIAILKGKKYKLTYKQLRGEI